MKKSIIRFILTISIIINLLPLATVAKSKMYWWYSIGNKELYPTQLVVTAVRGKTIKLRTSTNYRYTFKSKVIIEDINPGDTVAAIMDSKKTIHIKDDKVLAIK